jgi:hypothetical protein
MLGLLCFVTFMTGFVADATMTTSFFRGFFNWKVRPAAVARKPGEPVGSGRAMDEEVIP